ncbi:hypothetical protein C2G38_2205793 [Gigaspora rosea]|uniref:Uncharacterized protein n=1 Tax=Gigaspora rosea TaxID=44941 RepID=A0A397UJY9_9GLOM|nr:hypothetical protein C2G38_2205793 [Gigaspora rosea]
MDYSNLAGFDSIFYFHQASISRLFALWQGMQQNFARNETYTEEIGTVLAENTDLTPFQ